MKNTLEITKEIILKALSPATVINGRGLYERLSDAGFTVAECDCMLLRYEATYEYLSKKNEADIIEEAALALVETLTEAADSDGVIRTQQPIAYFEWPDAEDDEYRENLPFHYSE